MPLITILGIDPALTTTGWGIIESQGSAIKYIASGTIKTKATETLAFRLAFIANEIEKIIIKFKPNITGLEEIFINVNAVSSIKLAHARGAIISVIGKHNIELTEFAPNKIKKTIVGVGKAEKEQVMYMINMIMPTAKITQLDEADALAAAYCCSVNYTRLQ
jgi:crossover junction endodeoxyribonuclease RuvC